MKQYSLSFAGAGKVATALCRELYRKKFKISQVYSRSARGAEELAGYCMASSISRPEYSNDTSLIIVAVPDHKLAEVLHAIKCPDETVVAHTAGSFGLDIFPDYLKHTGVLYPLQTFTAGREIDFGSVPFFIEASDERSSSLLSSVAGSIGAGVYHSDTVHRRLLHLAAVFACNFTNHLLENSKDIAEKAGFDFDVLKPLITETFRKAVELGPENSQTGPAVRNDTVTINKHRELIADSERLLKVYEVLTESILNYYKNHHK